jgi:hypothetical protein
MVSNGFWHIVSVVKEQSPPVLQKGTSTAQEVYEGRSKMSTPILMISTGIHRRELAIGLRLLGEASYGLHEIYFLRISAGLIAALILALRASRNEKRKLGDCAEEREMKRTGQIAWFPENTAVET